MQFTVQARVEPDATVLKQLDELGAFHARMKHLLYAEVARTGQWVKGYKTEFCAEHGITARAFNALAVEVQGAIEATTALLQANVRDARSRISGLKRKIKADDAFLTDCREDRIRTSACKVLRTRASLFARQRSLQIRQGKLVSLVKRLKAHAPGIAFGSRKLFKSQWALIEACPDATNEELAAYHAEWLVQWQASRSHQSFYLGSKDETGGNQTCTATLEGDGTFSLRVRHLSKDGFKLSNYVQLKGIRFVHGAEQMARAFTNGQALTWRLHRDEKGWRVFASFSLVAPLLRTNAAGYGAVGVDFNEDHLGLAEVDNYGNLVNSGKADFGSVEDTGSGARQAQLSDHLTALVRYAAHHKLPVICEDLDFEGLKRRMSLEAVAARRNRKLSGLLYAQFLSLLSRKCEAMGVELVKVNPAYTSTIGRMKYARALGLSVHLAAALVVARRGQGRVERLPKPGTLVSCNELSKPFCVPVRTPQKTERSSWAELHAAFGEHRRKEFATRRRRKTEAARVRGFTSESSVHGQATVPQVRPTVSLAKPIPGSHDDQVWACSK